MSGAIMKPHIVIYDFLDLLLIPQNSIAVKCPDCLQVRYIVNIQQKVSRTANKWSLNSSSS